MFPDYQRLIVEKYEQKKAANTLSLRLIHPTPARLREECAEVFKARFERRDENMLKGFFGERNDKAAYLQAIERCDIDKFRPLIKFLKGGVINSDVRNIELLAWLIDFEPRPWQIERKYGNDNTEILSTPEKREEGEIAPQEIIKRREVEVAEKQKVFGGGLGAKKATKEKKIIAIVLITILLCVSGYLAWNMLFSASGLNRQEGCMYWNVDHYEPISCNKKLGENTLIVALDPEKIRNFKRIMNTDTLTYRSIGKVWYVKISNRLEYYTSRGQHPLQPNVELKPITEYIIHTYILADSLK